jgi:hypothetical protein
MDVISVAIKIEERIKLLELGRKELQKRAEKKAGMIAEYEKALSKRILELKTQGELPATLIEKVARGDVWKERLNADLSESEYKNAIVGMSSIESEISAYQSINRYLSET